MPLSAADNLPRPRCIRCRWIAARLESLEQPPRCSYRRNRVDCPPPSFALVAGFCFRDLRALLIRNITQRLYHAQGIQHQGPLFWCRFCADFVFFRSQFPRKSRERSSDRPFIARSISLVHPSFTGFFSFLLSHPNNPRRGSCSTPAASAGGGFGIF